MFIDDQVDSLIEQAAALPEDEPPVPVERIVADADELAGVLGQARDAEVRADRFAGLVKEYTAKGSVRRDALTARLIERAGFRAYQVGGFALAGARYAFPDIDLIHFYEENEAIRQIVSRAVSSDEATGWARYREWLQAVWQGRVTEVVDQMADLQEQVGRPPPGEELAAGDPRVVLAEAVTLYLNAQIAAGAQAVMIFDTWGGVLGPRDYAEFSLAYMERILRGLTRESEGRRVPAILFTKGGGQWLEPMAATGCDALGVDWTTDLADARARTGSRVALQGNMDPCVLYASPARIRAEVERILASYGPGPGHVFNLGHGIHPDVDPEHAAALVAAVHELSPRYHGR